MASLHLRRSGPVYELLDGSRVVAQGSRAVLLERASRLLGGPLTITDDRDDGEILTRRAAPRGVGAEVEELRAELAAARREIARLRGELARRGGG